MCADSYGQKDVIKPYAPGQKGSTTAARNQFTSMQRQGCERIFLNARLCIFRCEIRYVQQLDATPQNTPVLGKLPLQHRERTRSGKWTGWDQPTSKLNSSTSSWAQLCCTWAPVSSGDKMHIFPENAEALANFMLSCITTTANKPRQEHCYKCK